MKCIAIESYWLLNAARLFVDCEKFSIHIPGKAFRFYSPVLQCSLSLSDALLPFTLCASSFGLEFFVLRLNEFLKMLKFILDFV